MIECAIESCTNKIPDNYWSKTKNSDWFFSREQQKSFCPDHIPEWVEEWRWRKKHSQE